MDLIIGGGEYGRRAACYLIERQRQFVVVDPDPFCPAAAKVAGSGSGRYLRGGIGTAYRIIRDSSPGLVFPTAPVHVAARIVCKACGFCESPDDAQKSLPGIPEELVLGFRGGSICLSLNCDCTCLPDCPAPDICPVTGVERTYPLHERLIQLLPDAYILESRQVAPGLGAFRGRDIAGLMRQVRGRPHVCVGTACRCHGVVSMLEVMSSPDDDTPDSLSA
ncbi:MAG: hypothetical protein WC382_04640 [Methanoregulaceae archaeon]|jgi:hypothetical protein